MGLSVSVLMSCYNASRYLSEAMESILSQTYGDYEFIVVNDGSIDGTLEIVHAYAQRDRRIRILDKANTGLADSLNAGMRMARAEWIARQDADDISLPDRFARQVAFLRGYSSVVLLGTGCTLIDEHGRPGRDYQYPAGHDALVAQICSGGSPFPHASAVFHRQTAMGLGGYSPRFTRSQDIDMWLRLSCNGDITCIPEPLVKIRKHSSNISNHNGGQTSAVMGMAARVCHFLRMKEMSDPSQGTDAGQWSAFLEWLALRLEQSGHLEQRYEWTRLRYLYSSSPNKAVGACRLLKGLATSRCGLQVIHKKCFRSDLPARLAEEWMEGSCAVSSE